MLEVLNGFLLTYFVILCTINTLVSSLVKPIATCFARPTSRERTIWAEMVQLKKEQKEISMKDEFAAYSKLQRRINKLDTELKEFSQSRISKSLAIKGSVHIGLQVLCGLLIVLPVIWYRREPIVVLKVDLFPLTSFLGYPSNVPNAITAHVWVIISNISIRSMLRPFTS